MENNRVLVVRGKLNIHEIYRITQLLLSGYILKSEVCNTYYVLFDVLTVFAKILVTKLNEPDNGLCFLQRTTHAHLAERYEGDLEQWKRTHKGDNNGILSRT